MWNNGIFASFWELWAITSHTFGVRVQSTDLRGKFLGPPLRVEGFGHPYEGPDARP